MSSSRRAASSPAAQPGEQVDGLAAGEARPQLDVAGHVGEPAVQLDRVVPGVAAEQPCGAGVGAQQAEQDADGGGLPGAVGSEEAVYLAGLDREVESVECAGAAEGLDQAGDRDGCGGLWSCCGSYASSEICEVKEALGSGHDANWEGGLKR